MGKSSEKNVFPLPCGSSGRTERLPIGLEMDCPQPFARRGAYLRGCSHRRWGCSHGMPWYISYITIVRTNQTWCYTLIKMIGG